MNMYMYIHVHVHVHVLGSCIVQVIETPCLALYCVVFVIRALAI